MTFPLHPSVGRDGRRFAGETPALRLGIASAISNRMMRSLLRASIERATVTSTQPEGIAARIDAVLLRAAGILPFEEIAIVNLHTGELLRTYALPAVEGSGAIEVFAAERHPVRAGDPVAILSFGLLHDGQTLAHAARIVTVDAKNRLLDVAERPSVGDGRIGEVAEVI